MLYTLQVFNYDFII